ncbi:MAG: TlpA disulfide reductase family protein [Acidobacteriota bacterium]
MALHPRFLGRWILAAAFALVLAPPAWSGTQVGQPAEGFTLTSVEGGKSVRLSDLKGKPTVVVFWATWCPPCRREIPDLKALHREFGPKGLNLLAVAVAFRESKEDVIRFKQDYELPYPVLWDEENRVSEVYGVAGIPTVILVDPEGVIRYRQHYLDESLRALLQSYLPKG